MECAVVLVRYTSLPYEHGSYFFMIERISFHAMVEHVVVDTGPTSVQKRLKQLARKSDFKAILKKQVDQHKLVLQDVQSCAGGIYGKLPQHPEQYSPPILLKEDDFRADELVALITFFRIQNKWAYPVPWKVVWKSGEEIWGNKLH
jgi:hypothetical protein